MFSLIFMVLAVFTETEYKIPPEKMDNTKIYYGEMTQVFSKPAEIDFDTILKETPEYKELKNKKIEPGTGKYWILLNKATESIMKLIPSTAKENNYDIVSTKGYFKSINIEAEDITILIIDKVNHKDTKKSKQNKPQKTKE